jgi:hypothetical protein
MGTRRRQIRSASGAGPVMPQRPTAELQSGPSKAKGAEWAPFGISLLAEAQLRDQVTVAGRVFALEVIEQRAALVDQHQKAAARVVVLRVDLEMLGQVDDTLGQDRDLDLGRTRVFGPTGMRLDQFLLLLSGNRHQSLLVSHRLNPRTTLKPSSEASTSATGVSPSVAR